MVGNATPARREGLVRAARKIINSNRKVFTIAGKRLGEIYSEEYLNQLGDDGRWDDKSTEELIFPRLDCARLGVIYDDCQFEYSEIRFEEPMRTDDRKLAASMVVLTLILAIDPMANEYISETMCPLAALPWEFGEHVPGVLGRCMFSWVPSKNNSINSPPGEVLDLLERAKWSASTGDVMPMGMIIPTGDGQPCDEPGTNRYDELRRALDDVCRYVGVFKGNATEWADVIEFEFGDELSAKKQQILEYNREWWAGWEPAVRRARDASIRIDRSELQSCLHASLGGLGRLANIFNAPMVGHRGEAMGDHLLTRGALSCDKDGQSSYPHEAVAAAYKPIGELIERLVLYVDGTVEDLSQAVNKDQPATVETYQPANYFPQKMHGRIRMAAIPDRKSKRVRKQIGDGVARYCVEDVERWWPEDMGLVRQSAQG